jgi:hypothetical protein
VAVKPDGVTPPLEAIQCWTPFCCLCGTCVKLYLYICCELTLEDSDDGVLQLMLLDVWTLSICGILKRTRFLLKLNVFPKHLCFRNIGHPKYSNGNYYCNQLGYERTVSDTGYMVFDKLREERVLCNASLSIFWNFGCNLEEHRYIIICVTDRPNYVTDTCYSRLLRYLYRVSFRSLNYVGKLLGGQRAFVPL